MKYTRLPKQEPVKAYPIAGSMFLVIDQGASLAVVNAWYGSGYVDKNSRLVYTILSNGQQGNMTVDEWRHRVHVEQVENLVIREVD